MRRLDRLGDSFQNRVFGRLLIPLYAIGVCELFRETSYLDQVRCRVASGAGRNLPPCNLLFDAARRNFCIEVRRRLRP
jgi:hypothetical protein